MDEIKEWLESPSDYEAGKQLYNAYAPRYRQNDILAGQINRFENSFTFKILKTELEAILETISAKTSKAVSKSMKFHKVGKSVDLPEDLKKLSDEIPLIFKRRDKLRYESRDVEPGDKLREMAFEIVDLDQEIRRRYKVLDFFERTGSYPPGYGDPEAYEKSEIDKLIFWLQASHSYPSWISRNKDKPEKAKEVEQKRKVMADIYKFLKDVEGKDSGA